MSLRRTRIACLIATLGLTLSGCAGIMRASFPEATLPAEIPLRGLSGEVKIRRDELGIPFIEAQSIDDLMFAQGFVAARDRLSQMLGLRLMSQGRLAEMAGPAVLDIDRYMRTQNMRRTGQLAWDNASPQMKQYLQRYADGVNAYLARKEYPADIKLSGYQPEPWTPQDSLIAAELVNFALAQNLHEELALLRHAQAVGTEKAAWLHPIYPDEPLPFEEVKKLAGLDLQAVSSELKQLKLVQAQMNSMGLTPLAASNNWVVHKSRTAGGASLFANDTHLLLTQPSFWNYAQLRAPGLSLAGVGVAGAPGIMAGYNGHIAWGMTMVMTDNQDIFLEQLKDIDGKLHYLYQDQWLPCKERQETFKIKGDESVTETIYETRHGPLLNKALANPPKTFLSGNQLGSRYGIALQQATYEADRSADAFLKLSQATSVEAALPHVKQIRMMGLNIVLADKDNIAWQVTGRHPIRKNGLGMLPSPGWTGEYDWQGFIDPAQHPFLVNPPPGFISSANNRKLPTAESHRFSTSWYFPERGERADQLLAARSQHDVKSMQAMQADQHSLFADKFVRLINQPAEQQKLQQAIEKLPAAQRENAQEALRILLRFDGNLNADSTPAAVWGAFLHSYAIDTFGDELGPLDGQTWQAFMVSNDASYGAINDHLLGREDSPFWDNIVTPQKETRADTLARAMADSIDLLQQRIGNDRGNWAWGKLHTYTWQTEGSKLSKHLGSAAHTVLGWFDGYFNYGPYPAGGDHTTLNVSSYRIGENFDAWLVPAMRIIVDFSRDEPMQAVNSSGQSSNPSSPHYSDGNDWWYQHRYQAFPFKAENIDRQYQNPVRLVPGK